MPEHQQIQQSKKTNTIFQNQATPVVQTPVSNPYSIIQRAKVNPRSLTRADIMQLQRTIGNQAVGRLLSSIGSSSTAQQATVQRQEIPEEEEPLQGKMIETIQRQEIPEEEEPLQGKMIGTVQRQEIPEEEEPLQNEIIETVQRQEIPEEGEHMQGKFENNPAQMSCHSCFTAPIVQFTEDRKKSEEEMKAKLRQEEDRVAGFGSQVSSATLLAMSKGTKVHITQSGHQDTRNATNMDQASGQIGRGQSANNHGINQGNNALRLQQQVTPDITNAERTMAARTVRSLKAHQDKPPSRKEDKSKRNSQQEQTRIAERKEVKKKQRKEAKHQKALEEAEKKDDLKKVNRLRSQKKK